MIGQDRLKKQVDQWVCEHNLPKFLILMGEKGCGKKTLVSYIKQKLNCEALYFNNKTEDIRTLIEVCTQRSSDLIYVIEDGQDMSSQAANALLKVAEEPPTGAYIILLTTTDNLLATIKSRGQIVLFDPYNDTEKLQFAKQNNLPTVLIDYCDNLGDIVEANEEKFEELNKFCINIVDNIKKANITSALKITNKLKLKEDKPGYNINLFINMLAKIYYDRCLNNIDFKINKIHYNIVLDCKKQLRGNFNKQYILDEMLIRLWDIRYGNS